MANARSITAGESRVISRGATDNPKLCEKKLSDGRLSLYLNYYLGFDASVNPDTGKRIIRAIRQKKSLNLYLYDNPRTPEEREHNRQTREIASKLRYEAEQQMKQRETGYRVTTQKTETDFLQYYREYITNYTKQDIKNLRIALQRFVEYLKQAPKYRSYAKGIKPNQITKDMILGYTEYLQGIYNGEGAHTVYARFKKVVKYAVEHDVFTKNPCAGISIKIDRNVVKKSVLSLDEIQALASTPFPQNADTARAFLFSCLTGLRWCDVKNLTFANVDYSNRVLSFFQQKTEGHSSNSGVTIPLNDTTMALIGEKGAFDDRIFSLPSYEAASKCVKSWVKKAGIDKHISWHCARHSFAVNVLSNGTDIKTVSSLLGHSSIAMTEKYLHVIDNLKRAAMENPAMNIKL